MTRPRRAWPPDAHGWTRTGLAVLVGLVASLLPVSAAGAAVRPADGHWQTGDDAQLLSFSVGDGGTRLFATNGLVGDVISCGWAGGWATPDVVPISGGAFAAHTTGAAAADPDQISVTGTFTSRTTASVVFTLTCLRNGQLITKVLPFTLTTNAPPPPHCASARVAGDTLQLGGSGVARAHPTRYRHRAAIRIERRGVDCGEVESVLDDVLHARDESAALAGSGYVVERMRRLRVSGRRAYRVTARKGLGVGASAIAYVRYGALHVDHSIYRAGQQLFFDAGNDPPQLSPCTAGFVVQDPATGLVGLSAGHCGDPSPQPTGLPVKRGSGSGGARTLLGSVLRGVLEPGLDAVEFSLDARYGVAQQIERGELPPLTVVGAAEDASIGRGTRVCFAGRSSGAQECGRVQGFKDHLHCVGVKTRPGDSGGPVYTDPGSGLTTHAVGVVTSSHEFVTGAKMCFTPLTRVLGRFGASLPVGPFLR